MLTPDNLASARRLSPRATRCGPQTAPAVLIRGWFRSGMGTRYNAALGVSTPTIGTTEKPAAFAMKAAGLVRCWPGAAILALAFYFHSLVLLIPAFRLLGDDPFLPMPDLVGSGRQRRRSARFGSASVGAASSATGRTSREPVSVTSEASTVA